MLYRMVFRWVFIPWLQRELDAFRNRLNNTIKRADRNKVLPHGVPNEMYESPGEFGVLDFKVSLAYCLLHLAVLTCHFPDNGTTRGH